MDKTSLLQRLLGVSYLVAGIAKFVPAIEDVGEVLTKAAHANASTALAGPSDWLASHALAVRALVALAMVSSGLVQLLDRGPVRAACAGQMLMLICFSTIIHRSTPLILPVDLAFFAAAAFVIVRRTRATPPVALERPLA